MPRCCNGERALPHARGNAKRGIASGTFKTGRFSKYLPVDHRQPYEAAVNDPELLNLSDGQGVLDARLHELMQGLGGDVPGRKLGAEG